MTQKKKIRKVAQQLGKRTMLAIIAMLIVGAVNAQKPKLAVMDFMAGVGLYQNDVNGLSDMLINSLFNTGRFELIERGQLCELIGETNLQKSNLSAGQLQQLAIKGVNFLLLGTVNLTGGEYNIDVRVVDVGSGQLYSTAGVTKLSGQTYRDMMPKLANELATKLPQTVNATVTVTNRQPNVSKPTSVVTLLGYLQVSPDDIGEFSSVPTNIIANINKQELYGYDDWRLPTQEELDLMKANNNKIGLNNGDYMTSTGRSGNVRLVTTGKTVNEKKVAAAEQAERAEQASRAAEQAKQARIAAEQAEQASRAAEQAKQARERNGVTINGITWAVKNLGASKEEETGNYYALEPAKIACPQGWRLPTRTELQKLADAGSVWTSQNGVYGRVFGNGNNTIFLPAAGYNNNPGIYYSGTGGYYRSSDTYGWFNNVTYFSSMFFDSGKIEASVSDGGSNKMLSVRCVKN